LPGVSAKLFHETQAPARNSHACLPRECNTHASGSGTRKISSGRRDTRSDSGIFYHFQWVESVGASLAPVAAKILQASRADGADPPPLCGVIRTGNEKKCAGSLLLEHKLLRHIFCFTCASTSVIPRRSNNKGISMSHRFTIEALKELITARRDAERGLRICAEHVRESRLRWLLLAHLQDCAQALEELQSLVRLLGGDPQPPLADSPTAHRRWGELRAALACDEDGVILDECERGESRALEVYRNALDDPLPGLVRTILLRQFEDVMTNHDHIRDLRSVPSLRADPGAGSGAQAGQH
jgi:uncharacterized protein (TIGR02284 family)